MTGADLLEALSFVDEKYIQEAENARLSAKIPWVKVLSVAACLCILITGALALERMSAETEAAAPAIPESAEILEEPAAAAPKEEAGTPFMPEEAFSESAAEVKVPTDELAHVPYAKLRVVTILEDGSFEAIAEATQEMEMDTRVTVVVDPSKVPGAEETILDTIGVVEGALVEIYDGAFDASQNILYVAELNIP